MATPGTQLAEYFTTMDNQGGVIVKDAPKFDLETYIQNYRGRTRYDRLIVIGRCSVALCVDALKAAISEAKKGKDVPRYQEAVELLRLAAPNEPEATLDQHWVNTTEKKNKDETRRLESELKGYKNNLVRESIRMGNEDLGKHFEAIGELQAAADAFNRMRPDVSTTKQIIDVSMHLVRISVLRREWANVMNNLNKLVGIQTDDKALMSYAKIVSGIALLGQGKYLEAAQALLQATPSALPSSYADTLSPNDVAVYGALLALATMDRREIQTRVLESTQFRAYLEHEPHIRRAVTTFVNGRYRACLEILEAYRSDYLLDVHLQKHIPKIYGQIRSKCISQYLLPFSCVTLESLNESFAVGGESIEEELATMIRAGILNARINTIDKVVVNVSVKPRVQMQMTALNAAREYEREATDRVRRMNIAAADLEVRMPKRHAGGISASDEWIDTTIQAA